METPVYDVKTEEYVKCIEGSKRIRWDIDKDVLRGRDFDFRGSSSCGPSDYLLGIRFQVRHSSLRQSAVSF